LSGKGVGNLEHPCKPVKPYSWVNYQSIPPESRFRIYNHPYSKDARDLCVFASIPIRYHKPLGSHGKYRNKMEFQVDDGLRISYHNPARRWGKEMIYKVY
jgi:hypothetical protein